MMPNNEYQNVLEDDRKTIELLKKGYNADPAKGLIHGLQKDAIQNAVGASATKKFKDWKVTFELLKINEKDAITITDEGTKGLIGDIIPDQKDILKLVDEGKLDNEQHLSRFRTIHVSGGNEGPGSYGRGKLLFQACSKSHSILVESLRKDGKYILDRQLIEKIKNYDEEEIIDVLEKFENDLLERKVPKNNTVYDITKFQRGSEFISDIENDIQLFKEIQQELKSLDLVNHDPKREVVYKEVEELIKEGVNKRKVVVFSEYVDTIKHLEGFFRDKLGSKVLVCDGKVSKELAKNLNSDFNAQYRGTQTDHFEVLLTSDKLSEGFNLNRAGAIINYDIPWNPTRVIQRVGRINRIGAKVFDELYIFNFFPSETGADIVKSREIAAQKMFLIHNSLGEDSKIFHADEEPSPAGLFNKINTNPDDDEELSLSTIIRNKYKEIGDKYPEVITRISSLPNRVKSAKLFNDYQVNVLRKKGLSLFAQVVDNPSKSENKVQEIFIEELLTRVECEYDEKLLKLSSCFWPAYEEIKNHRPKHKSRKSDASVETKAFNNLKYSLKIIDPADEALASFIKVLIKDIRNYKTLSIRTLGRLGRIDLSPKSEERTRNKFFEQVRWIKNNLGDDYLDRLLKRVEHQRNEVIIAVENRK